MGHNILRASSPLTLERWLICQLVIPKSLLAHAFFHTNTVSDRSAHAPWHCLTSGGKTQRFFFFFFLIEIHFDFHSSFVTRCSACKYTPSPLPSPPSPVHPPTSNIPTGVLMLAVIMNHFLFDAVMFEMTGAQFRHCCPQSKTKLHGCFMRFLHVFC